jgi:hypothetical protein
MIPEFVGMMILGVFIGRFFKLLDRKQKPWPELTAQQKRSNIIWTIAGIILVVGAIVLLRLAKYLE